MKGIAREVVMPGGRIIPREGDLARVIEQHRYESGTVLKADQNVLVTTVSTDNTYVGVRWRDRNGTHVAAVPAESLEVVL